MAANYNKMKSSL